MMALPQNVAGSASALAKLVDEIWYLVGDRSMDFSYYTKRGLLSGVYVSTGIRSVCVCLITRDVHDYG